MIKRLKAFIAQMMYAYKLMAPDSCTPRKGVGVQSGNCSRSNNILDVKNNLISAAFKKKYLEKGRMCLGNSIFLHECCNLSGNTSGLQEVTIGRRQTLRQREWVRDVTSPPPLIHAPTTSYVIATYYVHWRYF